MSFLFMRDRAGRIEEDIRVVDHEKVASFERHPYHIVNPSPWPFVVAMNLWWLLLNTAWYLGYSQTLLHCPYDVLVELSIIFFLFSLHSWFYDIVVESTYEGNHTLAVQRNIRLGMVLFILS